MIPVRLVLCTVPSGAARDLARTLVERRLAACVNIVADLTSIYRWEGKICEDAESLMIIKTTAQQVERLTEVIQALHEYEVPEVISLPIQPEEGNPRYLDWLIATVSTRSEQP